MRLSVIVCACAGRSRVQPPPCSTHTPLVHACARLAGVFAPQVLGYELAVRLALLAPLRTPACLITGVLGAPVGGLVIAFMYVHALQQLMAWNSEVTMEAVELFHRVSASAPGGRVGWGAT